MTISNDPYPDVPAHIAAVVDNAAEVAPRQGGGGIHPPGKKLQATITDTRVRPLKDDKNQWLVAIEFTTPLGKIIHNYNRGNANETAVRIAREQMSALQHATGVMIARPANHYAELRNARCLIDVDLQRETEANKGKGYTELTMVYDVNGNAPGAPPQAGQAQTAQAAAFNGPATTMAPPAKDTNAGWGAPATGAATTTAATTEPAKPPVGW